MKLRAPVVITIAALAIAAPLATTANAAPTHTTRAHPATSPHFATPHFATPQAAMRYMAAAYNRHDATALHHVTTPYSYKQLAQMRAEAVNLQLISCSATGRGDYVCDFRHDYPKSLHLKGHGASQMIVAPALTPGWYLYAVEECG